MLRQPRGDLRPDDRPADDVHQVKKGQEEAREHRRSIELDDRLAGDRRVDDDHDRRWDQDSERPARCNDAGGKFHVVSRTQHRVEGDHAHQDHNGADEAAGNAPKGADDERRNGQRGGHAAERKLDAVEHLVHQRAAFHHKPHQHEQRDGDQNVIGHCTICAIDHQVEHAVVDPGLRRIVEGVEAEEHAEAHQGKGRRKAHHDDDHDEDQHQESEE